MSRSINENLIFVRAFKKARKVNKLTQRTIAAKLDLTPQTVNSYAIGKVEPGLSVMLKFAEACGYHLVDFLALGREEE
jgi:transcriptional regulator with XRE-family HTH domain